MQVNGIHKLGITLVSGLFSDAAADQLVKKTNFEPKGGDMTKIATAIVCFAGAAVINAFGSHILDTVGEEKDDE